MTAYDTCNTREEEHDEGTAGRRLHRQRLQCPFSHTAWVGVRDADILGILEPEPRQCRGSRGAGAQPRCRHARAYRSITEMVEDPAIDAIWLTGPNHTRLENVEEIVAAIESGRGSLRGLACEKPLARNVAEARPCGSS
jgi:predicted dehydrogenase